VQYRVLAAEIEGHVDLSGCVALDVSDQLGEHELGDRTVEFGDAAPLEHGDHLAACGGRRGTVVDVERPAQRAAPRSPPIALRGEPTGAPFAGHRAEVVCATRAPMRAGELIDGEGGYAAYGTCMPADLARERDLVPMGLAHGLRLTRDVPADHPIGRADVAVDDDSFLWRLRREQDAQLGVPVS
jgi:hypothetical protein